MKQKYLTLILWLAALAAAAGAMLLFEGDLLWKVQQKNLFLASGLYLRQQMVVPGGLLTWAATWFTQLLYYPWAGVLMLCAWWLLLMEVTKRAFGIPDRWALLPVVPVALLLIANMDLGYWIYVLKLRGHLFVPTIGTTAVAALLWGFRSIPDKHHLPAVYILIACAIGYPLIGAYALAATLLMGIWAWRLYRRRMSAVLCSVVAVMSVAAVLPLCLLPDQPGEHPLGWAATVQHRR